MPICIKDYATPEHLLSRTAPASAGPKFTSVPVRIIIGVDGRARNIHVIRASAEQRESITAALTGWQFRPFTVEAGPSRYRRALPWEFESGPRSAARLGSSTVVIPFKGSSRSHFILRRGGEVAGPRFPRHPARKCAVPVDQRVHQRRSEVGKECREQQKRKNHVRCPQRGVEGCVTRQDRRQFKRPIVHDRIACRRQHSPADERQGEHQRVQNDMRCMCRETLQRRHALGQQRGRG